MSAAKISDNDLPFVKWSALPKVMEIFSIRLCLQVRMDYDKTSSHMVSNYFDSMTFVEVILLEI